MSGQSVQTKQARKELEAAGVEIEGYQFMTKEQRPAGEKTLRWLYANSKGGGLEELRKARSGSTTSTCASAMMVSNARPSRGAGAPSGRKTKNDYRCAGRNLECAAPRRFGSPTGRAP